MEVKKADKIHPFRDLSLKWSFALYAAACVIAVLIISISLTGLFTWLQNCIARQYDEMYRDELAKQAYFASEEEVQGKSLLILTGDIRQRFSVKDSILFDLYGILNILVVPVTSVICIIATGVIFYMRKLKRPLAILDSASARIAEGDLDFNVEYDSRNEFGRLAASFEKMRRSLYEANREMWQMMEARRRLNSAFAHDLRTPLTVLRGYCDFLLKYAPEGKISNKKTIATLSTMDVYLKRLEGYTATMSSLQKLEEIANSFTEVEKSYAIQAGREIRIMVKPEVVSDESMIMVARDIVKKIESEMEYPGQIKVHIIRETRAVEYAK